MSLERIGSESIGSEMFDNTSYETIIEQTNSDYLLDYGVISFAKFIQKIL